MKNETLKQIVKEEIFSIKKQALMENIEKLREYVTASRVIPGFKIAKPWEGKYKAAENTLKQMGAKPYSNGLNPHGYELNTKEDRFQFSDDGSVYSTDQIRELGYEIKNGIIVLWNEPNPERHPKTAWKVGTISLQGNKPVLTLSKENTKKVNPADKKEQPNTWLDYLQTVMDWLGFIPGYGDIIDLINATIYAARGKWFDAFFSAIAVIPVIGSAIKVAAKSVYKGARLAKFEKTIRAAFKGSNDVSAQMKMWDELVETGVINPKDLARIGNGLESLESVLRSSYSTIRKAPISDNAADAIIKQLDEFAGWLRTNGKSIDEIANANKVGRKTTFKSATDITGASAKTLRQIEKINKTTSTIMLKLRGMKWFPDEKVAQIAKGLERRFKREMRDPLKLTALTKTLPTTDFSTILNVIERQISPRQLAYVRSLDPTSARDVQSIFRYLKQNAPDAYNKISTTIINRSIKTNSPIFNTFKTSDLNNLKTVLSKDMIPAGKTIFTDINLSTRKSLDIIWNEIHDVLESAGLEWDGTSFPTENKIDAADGVVWPALAKAVSEFFPGVYETTVETSESLKNFVTAVGADKGLRAAGELMKDKSKDTFKPKQRGTYK